MRVLIYEIDYGAVIFQITYIIIESLRLLYKLKKEGEINERKI